MKQTETAGTERINFAYWVKEALGFVRAAPYSKIGLFDSSVPEPSAQLSRLISGAFSDAPPDSYQSSFLRNHPELEKQLSDRYAVPAKNILCMTGATMAVSFALGTFCPPGSHVVIERPGFDIFRTATKNLGLEAGFFQRAAPGFEVRTDDVLAALKPNTRMVILTDLHNPSGVGISADQLTELAGTLAEKNIILMIDEVYRDYLERFTDGLDVTSHPNVLRVGSMTKNFGLNALRCGWIFAGDPLISILRTRFETVDFNVSKLSHTIAAEVLRHSGIFDSWRQDIMARSRPVISDALMDMEQSGLIEPGSCLDGCVCFPRLVGIDDTELFSKWLRTQHDIVVVPGECFGAAGHVRIGFAMDSVKLSDGLARLADGIVGYRERKTRRQEIA